MKIVKNLTNEENYKKLEEALKDAPPLFKEYTLKNFNRMKFESDEDFDEYLKETKEDLENYNKRLKNIND